MQGHLTLASGGLMQFLWGEEQGVGPFQTEEGAEEVEPATLMPFREYYLLSHLTSLGFKIR